MIKVANFLHSWCFSYSRNIWMLFTNFTEAKNVASTPETFPNKCQAIFISKDKLAQCFYTVQVFLHSFCLQCLYERWVDEMSRCWSVLT